MVYLKTNTNYNNPPIKWWWILLPLGIFLLVFMIAIGLEFRWAKGTDDVGGISAALAAPVDWAVRGTASLSSGVVGAAGKAGTSILEGTGRAFSGPFQL